MKLIVAVTGATGALAARILLDRSPWPVVLVGSHWGKDVYARECGAWDELERRAERAYDDGDLAAPIASGSTPTVGMVVLPCSSDAMARIAAGLGDTLIARAAHCHLKERRPLVLCVRETPWTLIDIDNAARVARAGGVIMPLSPPFYAAAQDASKTTMAQLLGAYADRVLSILGKPAPDGNWEKRW